MKIEILDNITLNSFLIALKRVINLGYYSYSYKNIRIKSKVLTLRVIKGISKY